MEIEVVVGDVRQVRVEVVVTAANAPGPTAVASTVLSAARPGRSSTMHCVHSPLARWECGDHTGGVPLPPQPQHTTASRCSPT
jgi:hypothetical protein